ncbi:MAG: M23 family metallopeptidase [Spirochaetales bacterium]
MRHLWENRAVAKNRGQHRSRPFPFSPTFGGRLFFSLLTVLVLTVAFTGHALESKLSLSVPDQAVQGTPFRVSLDITGGNAQEVRFYLLDPDGSEHSSVPAAAFHTDTGDTVWANVLAASPVAEPGDWRVRARVHFDDYSTQLDRPLTLGRGEFASMTIALNRELTSLITDPDPRRSEERRELNRLLSSSEPGAVYNPGTFVTPVVDPNRTSAEFGDRRIYEYHGGSESRSVHNGVDYAAPTGTETLAGAHGVVRLAADRLVSGRSVVIEHMPGVFSVYYHLDSIAVDEGDFVMAKEPIGRIGASGLATGAHLHWEVRIGGVSVDPEWFLSNAAVDTRGLLNTLAP